MRSSADDVSLDVLGLALAGLINTFLALFVAVVVVGPGTAAVQPNLAARAAWIAAHSARWAGGWLFWFAVTLSFSWSFFALGRHLHVKRPWPALAIGLALIAAAVDIVGVLVNLAVLPPLARGLGTEPGLTAVFQSMEALAVILTNVAAFGLYALAGALLLPALFGTAAYPRALAWLGAAEWGVALLATALLIVAPPLAPAPLLLSFALYAPWVWGSGWWLWRESQAAPRH